MNRKTGNLIWGVGLILMGVLVIGRFAGWWQIGMIREYWWTLLLIIPGAISIMVEGPRSGNILCFMFGSLLMLNRCDKLSADMTVKMAIPTVLLALGYGLLLKAGLERLNERISHENEYGKIAARWSAIAIAFVLSVGSIAAMEGLANNPLKIENEMNVEGENSAFSGSFFGSLFAPEKTKSESLDLSEETIKNLTISGGASKVTVCIGENPQVEFIDVPESYEMKLDGDSLIVRKKSVLSFGRVERQSEIKVVLPIGTELEDIYFDMGSGSWEVSGIKAENADVEVGSGKAKILLSEVKSFDATCGSGRLNMEDSKFENMDIDVGSGVVKTTRTTLGKLSMECGSGNVTADDVICTDVFGKVTSGSFKFEGKMTGECEFDLGSGDIILLIEGKDGDYDIDIDDIGSGHLYVNGEKIRSGRTGRVKGNEGASNKIVFEIGSGTANVKYIEK